MKEKFIDQFVKKVIELYGEKPELSQDSGRVVNKENMKKLMDFLEDNH